MNPKPSAGPRRTFIRFDFLGRSIRACKVLVQASKGREVTDDFDTLADGGSHVLHFPSQLLGRSLQLAQRLMCRVEQSSFDSLSLLGKSLVLLLDGGYGFGNTFESLSCPSEDPMIESKVDKRIGDVLVHLHRCCSLPCRRSRGNPGAKGKQAYVLLNQNHPSLCRSLNPVEYRYEICNEEDEGILIWSCRGRFFTDRNGGSVDSGDVVCHNNALSGTGIISEVDSWVSSGC